MSDRKVTGYELREKIRLATQKLSTLRDLWNKQKTYFVSQRKEPPDIIAISDDILVVEQEIASLQALQKVYNSYVMVPDKSVVDPEAQCSLAYLIKQLGYYIRMEKMWSDLIKDKPTRYYSMEDSRRSKDKDTELAQLAVAEEKAVEQANYYAEKVSMARMRVAQGNSTPVSLSALDPKFFGEE